MSGQRVDFTPTGKPISHNRSAYTNHGCRCETCTEDQRAYVEGRRIERRIQEPPTHGSESTYSNWCCRCFDCRAAHTEAARRKRASRTN